MIVPSRYPTRVYFLTSVTRDFIIALLGIALSITAFIAQGPYKAWWQYGLGLAPAFVALVLIATATAIRKYNRLRHALALATGVRLETWSVLRAENTNGDVSLERTFRLSSVSDVTRLQFTMEEALFLSSDIGGIPPEAHIVQSHRPNRQLSLKASFIVPVTMRGQQVREYGWSYRIDPPLAGKGDYVEYVTEVRLPRAAADAFTEKGDIFACENIYFGATYDVTIFAPAGYRVELLESWLEDFDGKRLPLRNDEFPRIAPNARELHWNPTWRKGARHLCRYRFTALRSTA